MKKLFGYKVIPDKKDKKEASSTASDFVASQNNKPQSKVKSALTGWMKKDAKGEKEAAKKSSAKQLAKLPAESQNVPSTEYPAELSQKNGKSMQEEIADKQIMNEEDLPPELELGKKKSSAIQAISKNTIGAPYVLPNLQIRGIRLPDREAVAQINGQIERDEAFTPFDLDDYEEGVEDNIYEIINH